MPKLPDFSAPFLQLSAANILSNLLVPMAGLIDTAFLGHLSEIRHLGGVAIATVLFNYLYWTFGFLRMGMTGLVAQAVGQSETSSDRGQIWLLLLRNGAIALLVGSLILMLQLPLRELGFALLNASAEVRASGIAFFNGCIWGAPATLLNFVLLGWLLGRAQGRRVLVLSAIASGTNILLDYWMIAQLNWASFGAGLATAASQYAMLVAGLVLVWADFRGEMIQDRLQRPAAGERFGQRLQQLRSQFWHPPAFRRLFQLNRDILIRTFALVTAFSLFTNFSAALGTEVLAANALLLQAVSLAAYFIDGIAFATETFAGRFWAAGQPQQLRSLLNFGLALSLSLGIGFAIAFITFPGLFRLLTDHTNLLTEVRRFSPWLLPVIGLGSIAYFLDGYFLGITAGRVLRNSSLLAVGVFFLPLALLAQHQSSVSMLWVALVGLMAGRALTLGWALKES